jgi:glutathione S-transferase
MTASHKTMTIYGVPLSVHTRKVILIARIKSIPHQVTPVIPVIPSNPPPAWRTLSPTGLIPAIDDNGYVLADSTAIAHYLERKVPEPALVPGKPEDCGRALFLDAWAGDVLFRKIVHPIFHNQVVSPNIHNRPGDAAVIDTALGKTAPEAFGYLEGIAGDGFLIGGRLSIADLAVVSNLVTFHYLGHRIDAARHPRLAAYFRRHLDSSPLRAALADEAPFVDNLGLDRTFLA